MEYKEYKILILSSQVMWSGVHLADGECLAEDHLVPKQGMETQSTKGFLFHHTHSHKKKSLGF